MVEEAEPKYLGADEVATFSEEASEVIISLEVAETIEMESKMSCEVKSESLMTMDLAK